MMMKEVLDLIAACTFATCYNIILLDFQQVLADGYHISYVLGRRYVGIFILMEQLRLRKPIASVTF